MKIITIQEGIMSVIAILLIVIIGFLVNWEIPKLVENQTIIASFLILGVIGALTYGWKPRFEKFFQKYDKDMASEQKIKHSKETFNRIFEHLCSTEARGDDELVLSIPIPLQEYYKAHEITDILTHEYVPKSLEQMLNNNEHNYSFVPITENPLNVEWGLKHLEDKEYSHVFSNYKKAQVKYKEFNTLLKESKSNMDKKIQEQITNVFFANKKIPDHIPNQIRFMIENAVTRNYSIYHRDVSNVCITTQEDIDSKQLHKSMNSILQDDSIITQRQNIIKTVQEGEELLTQFKKDIKKLVMNIRDDVLVKGKCKGCESK